MATSGAGVASETKPRSDNDASAAAECAGSVSLDFAGLAHGELLNDQYADIGVHISASANEGRPNQLIVFNSNESGTRDPDLEAGIGNLAIIPEHVVDEDNDGNVDDPNDSIRGGVQTYAFDQDVTVNSFVFVDKDSGPIGSATAFDSSGDIVAQVDIPNFADGNVQTVVLDASGVRRLEISYRDSGGVTDIDIDCPAGATATPTATSAPTVPTPTPTPTNAPTAPTPTPTPAPSGSTPTPAAAPSTASPTPTQAPVVAGAGATPPSAVAGVVRDPGAQGATAQQFPSGGGPVGAGNGTMAMLLLLGGAGMLASAAFLITRTRTIR